MWFPPMQRPRSAHGTDGSAPMPAARRRAVAPPMIAAAMMIAAAAGAQPVPTPTASSSTTSSARLFVGVGAGIDAVFDRAQAPVYPGSYDCGAFDRATAARPHADAELVLPELFAERLGLGLALGIEAVSGMYTALPTEPTVIVDETTGALLRLDREYHRTYRETSVRARIAAEYRPAGPLLLRLGIGLAYRLSTTHRQTDVVTGPGNLRFADGLSEHPMPDGAPFAPGALALEPTFAVGYTLPLGARALLQPVATVSYDVASAAGGERIGVGIGARLLFDLTPVPPPALNEPIAKAPAPTTAPLAVAVRMTALDSAQHGVPLARISINEVISRRIVPLLPAVFFERDATSLPGRYVPLAPEEADRFARGTLENIGTYDMQHLTLDIVGARMRAVPDATLTLTGITSSDEEPRLGARRAERVRDYLMSVWGIAGARLRIGAGNGFLRRSSETDDDGRADNRRVEIASDRDTVTAPVTTELVSREFNPPIVRVEPVVNAGAGVKRWAMTISQGPRRVANYGGDQRGGLERADFIWRLADSTTDAEGAGLSSLLSAELTVEDSAGAVATARADVPLTVERHVLVTDGRIERFADLEHIQYTLVGFDFDSEGLGHESDRALRDMASMTHTGARVTIVGYTDRIGNENRNRALSAARAAKASARMRSALLEQGIRDVTVEMVGAGVETSRFTNETPEGRMLSRSVLITVDQDAVSEQGTGGR